MKNVNDLDFITDAGLRQTIENSTEYMYALSEEAKEKEKSDLYKEETYRVIMLYTVSVIEAVLLYLYKKHEDEMTFLDYKFVQPLPSEYGHSSNTNSRVVVAVQKREKMAEHKIGMGDLVCFFKERNLMKKETAEQILQINDLRNTFHLSKPRDKAVCDIVQVESALKLLVYVIQNAPKSVLKKR